MTGYGQGRAVVGGGALIIELRSVNHRFLDVKVRFPAAMLAAAAIAEEIARKRLARGRVELTCRSLGAVSGTLRLDTGRARQALSDLRALRDELLPDQELPMSLLSAVPDLFSAGEAPVEGTREAVREAMEQACEALEAMRAREGAALQADLTTRLQRVRDIAGQIAQAQPRVREALRARTLARIEELLQATGTAVDGGRLEHEIAVQADRSDISEELTRLQSHCAQFEQLLQQPDAPVGRKLEFLLQELGREANTTGAKVWDVELTRSVLDLKAELERLREQVQNVL